MVWAFNKSKKFNKLRTYKQLEYNPNHFEKVDINTIFKAMG